MPQRTAKHRRTQKPAKADSSDTDDNSDDKPTWDGTELKSAPFAHKLKNYLPLQINGLRPFIRYGLINDKRSNTIFFNQEHGTLYRAPPKVAHRPSRRRRRLDVGRALARP